MGDDFKTTSGSPPAKSVPAATARVCARPALFRALGRHEPPACMEVAGQTYALEEVYKHDSWAATAVYILGSTRIVAKFNRRQSIFGLPMQWLGHWLARREASFLTRLGQVAGVPRFLGRPSVSGQEQKNAIAREHVAGQPLHPSQNLPPVFFDKFQALLDQMHLQQMAYVDLHKRENVIAGEDGQPYLIDFQVSYAAPRIAFLRQLCRPWLRTLQAMDRHNFLKLKYRMLRDRSGISRAEIEANRPLFVRVHRTFAAPLRSLRRQLLVWLGVRQAGGRVESEHFAEAAFRTDHKAA